MAKVNSSLYEVLSYSALSLNLSLLFATTLHPLLLASSCSNLKLCCIGDFFGLNYTVGTSFCPFFIFSKASEKESVLVTFPHI